MSWGATFWDAISWNATFWDTTSRAITSQDATARDGISRDTIYLGMVDIQVGNFLPYTNLQGMDFNLKQTALIYLFPCTFNYRNKCNQSLCLTLCIHNYKYYKSNEQSYILQLELDRQYMQRN